MALVFECVGVVGATGPIGRAVVRELVARKIPVRAVSRNLSRLAAAFPYDPIVKRSADARDIVALSACLAGCDLVVDCIGLPAHAIDQHVVAARTLAANLRATGARCLLVSSTWSYMPIRELPLDVSHPRQGGTPLSIARREAEDALIEAGAAIVHLPDFYGPNVHTSTMQMALANAVAGGRLNWIGGADIQRDYIFVPDAARIATELMVHEQAYGAHWMVPGSGPISASEVAEIVSRELARDVRPRSAGPILLRALSLFDRDLAAFNQLMPEYLKPVSYDGARLEQLIGPMPRTPHRQAIAKTLGWLGGTDG